MSFKEVENGKFPQFERLKEEIVKAYEEGISMEDAERNAARCLDVQIELNEKIKASALDARMKKNGYKTHRATEYLKIVQGSEKKPTESQIDAMLTVNTDVCRAQDDYEAADIEVEALKRYFDIFKDAHIFFRSVARGNPGV